MENKKGFLLKFISLMLTLVISITMTTVSFANEIDNKYLRSEELSHEDVREDNKREDISEKEIDEIQNKEDIESDKEENKELKEEKEIEITIKDEVKESRYNKNVPAIRIPYLYGTGGANFNPNQDISREEAYIAFLRSIEILETGKNPLSYPMNKILEELEKREVYLEGYRKSDLKGKITRAEIADIVDQYLRLEQSTGTNSIDRVVSYSFMSLDKNSNFNADRTLSRAEMVTVLNRIQNRNADKNSLTNIPQIYKDLPKSHWAYAEILESTIAHTVDVNTDQQKWTSHTLSDNDQMKIQETEKHKSIMEPLIKHGIRNPNENQMKAIEKMNEYIANNNRVKQDFNNGRSLIFAFEGAGDYNNKWNKTMYHNEGRYGAMYVVVKNKQIVYITTNGSTLPDNPKKGIRINGVMKTVRSLDSQRENISNFISGNHRNYPGMIPHNLSANRENRAQKVKSLQGLANNGTRMNIHSGRSDEGSMSDGCLTIRDKEYIKFAKTVGYMPSNVGNNKNNFRSIQRIGQGKFVPNVKITLILDRSLMDGETKTKFWK